MMGAAALGIRNLLLLTGDDPKAGDQPDTKPVFDIDSKTLIETARRLRDDGTLPTGRKVGGKADFFIGAADMPIDPPAGWQPNALLGKVKSGAQFAQTQFCMDAAIVRRYVGALEAAGITKQLAILIGVNPLRSAKSAAWMKSHLYGTIIPDAFIARLEKADRPGARGRSHLRRTDRGAFDHSRRRRRPHHGAGQRRGDSGGDHGGAGAREKIRFLNSIPCTRQSSRPTRTVDQLAGIVRYRIAPPGHVPVRPHQHQFLPIKRRGLRLADFRDRQRHAARLRRLLKRSRRRVAKAQQHKAAAE